MVRGGGRQAIEAIDFRFFLSLSHFESLIFVMCFSCVFGFTDSDMELSIFYKNHIAQYKELLEGMEEIRTRLERLRKESTTQEDLRRTLLRDQGKFEALQQRHDQLRADLKRQAREIRDTYHI